MPQEIKKITRYLIDLPEELQQETIKVVDESLPLQFSEEKLPLMSSSTSIEFDGSSYLAWCDSRGIFIRNLFTKETYQKDHVHDNDREAIKFFTRAPKALLFATASDQNMYLYSGPAPLQLLHTLKIANESLLAFSFHDNPMLFVANSAITVISNIINNGSMKPQQYECALPAPNMILSLAVAPNNKFLIIGCKDKPSYKYMIDEGVFEEIPIKGITSIGIARDSALVALSKKKRRGILISTEDAMRMNYLCAKTRVLCNGEDYSIQGQIVEIKDNCITTVFDNNLCSYNKNGQLLHKYALPTNMIITSKMKDCYCLVRTEGYREQQFFLMRPETLAMNTLDKLVYKLAIEKARATHNEVVLKKLLSSIGAFKQPLLLYRRIDEGLKLINNQKKLTETVSCLIS